MLTELTRGERGADPSPKRKRGVIRPVARAPGSDNRPRAFTLLEVLLALGLVAILAVAVIPNLWGQLIGRRLPESARQMRSLLQLTRANAMLDGKRYRLRFPLDKEWDSEGTEVQPIIEVEAEPFIAPGVYVPATAPWAQGETLLEGVWCARVRQGKPRVAELLDHIDEVTAELDEELKEEDVFYQEFIEEFDENYPPLVIEPDGTSEWYTFVIIEAPRDADEDDLAGYPRIEVIYDGLTGLTWLQRPFYEEELEMFLENGWPAVLRKDFLRPEPLTETEVVEIQESLVRR